MSTVWRNVYCRSLHRYVVRADDVDRDFDPSAECPVCSPDGVSLCDDCGAPWGTKCESWCDIKSAAWDAGAAMPVWRKLRSIHEMSAEPTVKPLIEGLLEIDSTNMIYSGPKMGKSFVALSMAGSVATGLAWLGHRVATGPVPAIYIAGEGAPNLYHRLQAWSRAYLPDGQQPSRFFGIYGGVNFGLRAEADEAAQIVAHVSGGGPCLVVVDTVAQCGGPENDNTEMSRWVANLQMMRDVSQACIVVVHHTAAGGDEPRGVTALANACETVLHLKRSGMTATLRVKARRNGPEGEQIGIGFREVDGTLVVEAAAGDAVAAGLSAAAEQALATLATAGTDLPTTEWMRRTGLAERTFYRARNELCDRGAVVATGPKRSPLYSLTVATGHQITASGTANGDESEFA